MIHIKAIILAAGRGSRLNQINRELPKGEINVQGKTLIQRHIENLREIGINEIAIVTGYLHDKIQYPECSKYVNQEYSNTNMIYSLFCAKDFMNDDLVILYSDILLDESVYKEIVKNGESISIIVDKDWLNYWKYRFGSEFEQDLEALKIEGDFIKEIGSNIRANINEISGRYVGCIYVPKIKLNYFKNVDQIYSDYRKVDFTTYLSFVISNGEKVSARLISNGWYEIDTDNDYALFSKSENEIKRELNSLKIKL